MSSIVRFRAAGAASLLGCALLACRPVDPPAPPPRDLLLITIDTARTDRFSYTGATRPGTPHVDALAAAGAGFLNAITPVPLTLPAHASLLTGRQPPSHTVRDNGSYRLPDGETTLAEVLAQAGFTTAAFIGADVLDSRHGLAQGFDTYDEEIDRADGSPILAHHERDGDAVADRALAWLEHQPSAGRLFAWIHLYDPHTPYRPPEPERSRHSSRYDGEIAYVDRVIGRIVAAWERRRGLDRSVVVVTSDHGEALGDHGEATHGVLLYDAVLRVPLVIRAPGRALAAPVADAVHLIDVMPTVLEILGVGTPRGVQGRDLTPLLSGGSIAWSPIAGYAESRYAELHHRCAPLYALRGDALKLIQGLDEELYDLTADPAELDDLAGGRPQATRELSETLAAVRDELGSPASTTLEIDERARESLEALGYLSSRSPATAGICDPRQALLSMARMADADRLALAGDVAAAVAAYRAVIESEPASIDARVRLARLLESTGTIDGAIGLMVEAVALDPREFVLHYQLGHTLERAGRIGEALDAYDAGLVAHPDERDLRDGRWRCLNRLRRHTEMLAEAERAIARDPNDCMARFARAVACCSHPLDAYIAALEREVAELPDDPHLLQALAGARAEASR